MKISLDHEDFFFQSTNISCSFSQKKDEYKQNLTSFPRQVSGMLCNITFIGIHVYITTTVFVQMIIMTKY